MTEMNASDPLQCPVVGHNPSATICSLKTAESQQSNSDRLPEIEGQRDRVETPRHPLNISWKRSIESFSDPIPPIGKSSATGGSSVTNTPARIPCPGNFDLHQSSPTTISSPVELLGQVHRPSVCLDWFYGRCFRPHCKYSHCSVPPRFLEDAVVVPQRPPVLHPPVPPPAQTDPTQVPSLHQKVPTGLFPELRDQQPRTPMEPCAPAAAPISAVESNAVVVAAGKFSLSHPLASLAPYFQGKPTSTPPIGHVDAVSSRARPPPKPQERLLLRNTSSDEIIHSVMESAQVKFSGGFFIETIVTGFESRSFVIEDIPVKVDRAAIEDLVAPFGEVHDVRFRDDRQSDDCSSRPVFVRMATYREAVRAINGLDGIDAFGRRLDVKNLARRMIRDNYVHVSWPVPSKVGYAGYSTLAAAENAVSNANGKVVKGYWITASIYDNIPKIGDFNVRFTGLPPWVEEKFLSKFGSLEGAMLGRPNHQAPEFGVPAVRKTLENFGKVIKFIVTPGPYKDGIVRVWCQFGSQDVAGAACELHNVKQRSLGMEKISVRRVLSVIEHVPHARLDLVKQDLIHLQQKVWAHTYGAHLDFISRYDGAEAPIRLVAEDSKTLAGLRVEFKEIVDGEILKEDGQQVWDDFFRREAGFRFMEQLRGHHPGVEIIVHTLRRCVRLIGTVELRQPVAAAILAKLSSLRQHKVHTIPLDGQAMGVLASPDFRAAQQRHGDDNIRLDFQGHVLLVRGPEDVYEEVQQIVHLVKARHVADCGDDHCPVCLGPPMTPISLSCGHRWCKACLVAYLTAAADTRSFPISCFGNQGRCTERIAMRMARNVLNPADFDALALAAFHAYVQAHPEEYHYCPTPDCPQAYPNGPS
ncbi:hypothetical protein F5148DRAFT_267063 [Russula earlei]|uniref:Uncharacterized protein n=1 Tax=Russula earlei TaxID=71964 RepID=A0ACC0UJB3_9AGAM|nr:hypothetical protein F5148DRAFT_267063 [Russula earlei]